MSSHTKLNDNNIMNKLEYYLNKLNDDTTQDIPEPWYAPAGFKRGKISEKQFKAEYECSFQPQFVQDDKIDFNAHTKRIRVWRDITFENLYWYTAKLWEYTDMYEPFPFTMVTPQIFIIENGWDFFNDGTIQNIKDAGWEVHDESNQVIDQYTCIKTIGNDHKEQLSYSCDGDFIKQFSSLGQVNQAVRTWGLWKNKPRTSIDIVWKNGYACSIKCGITELQPNVIHIPVYIPYEA